MTIKYIKWPEITELKIDNINPDARFVLKRGDYLTTQGKHYKILYRHYDIDNDELTIHLK